ncbi:threonine/serine exporter family protein [Massilicoli timonensis]|uniref:threonine/serine exporter family protein n=1 Tax=Massilicoli timonensis TaxID=2015901 RepID=UPI000C8374D8|nr:threonine/serine exporter family protein [Massilicoli timonensis]
MTLDANRLLKAASVAGRMLLESGAETYRVEETIIRICNAYGVQHASSFVMPTGIMTSFFYEDRNYARVERVYERGTDLNKIHLINDLSRRIGDEKISVRDLEAELTLIKNGQRYSELLIWLFSGLSAFGFAFFFGGGLGEAFSSFLVGMAIKTVSLKMETLQINTFFNIVVSSVVAGFLSVFTVWIEIGSNLDIIIISSIMLLVPGIAITNAIRDTVAGDLVSGLTRACEAFLVAVAIALGVGFALSMCMSWIGGAL